MYRSIDDNLFCFSYKPVQMVHIVAPLKEQFERLFHATFSQKHNARFLASVQVCGDYAEHHLLHTPTHN